MKKIALIFGITGQDGAYLAEFLIKKNYKVHGVVRRSSSFNTSRIDHIYEEPYKKNRKLILHYGDVTDSISVSSLIKKIKPDEIYNLAAQSFVQSSFEAPVYTGNSTGLGVARILEALRQISPDTRFYQASSSEMFGKVMEIPQKETTPLLQTLQQKR